MFLKPLTRATLMASVVLAPAALAQQRSTAPASETITSWANPGSDIPVDSAWRLGTLPNGVHYAVRRGNQPKGSISIRVRIGVGGLMEEDAQQGWSHLLEHMVFRGTEHYADGEAIRLWQRLGASFGSDTNAQTTLTATTFQLDLPHPGAAEYGQAISVLAEMMDTARIDPALLATERTVVAAEAAQRLSPVMRKVRDAQQPLFFAGTKAATRDVIGTQATLAGASTSALKAYYKTWYRPENATVVVVGDADPATLEAGVARAFGPWRGTVPAPSAPDWGTPRTPEPTVATIADPQLPDTLALTFVAPHAELPFTITRQQRQFSELIAVGILNQRLAAMARLDKAVINAGAQRSEQRHVEDQLVVQIQSKPGGWKDALDQTYAVLNGAISRSPSQAEIDQQIGAVTSFLGQQVASSPTETSATLANGFVSDVDSADVSGAPEFYQRLFASGRAAFTPAAIGATLKVLLAPAPRLLILGPQPVAGGMAAAAASLASAEKIAGGAAAELRAVSLDQLVLPGRPSAALPSVPIPSLEAERVAFSDGVELVFKSTPFEKGKIRVRVDAGQGLLGEPKGDPGLWWTAPAMTAAGIGPFSAEELSRVSAGHQYAFATAAAPQSLGLVGTTNASDLLGMLKLMTGAIASPRFDSATVDRLRESSLANYASVFSQPLGVLQVFGGAALHGGDDRFNALPGRDAIERLTLPAFRDFWSYRLLRGPVRVTIVGDVDRTTAIAAVAATLGTIPKRHALHASGADVRATPPASPVVLTHRGDPDQAFIAHAWPTPSDLDDPIASAPLDLTASLIQTGLTEGFRATEGGSYTPIAIHPQTSALAHYGLFLAGAQVQTGRATAFGQALDKLVADLAANGPEADRFARALATAISSETRRRDDNGWWLQTLSTELTPERVAAIDGRPGVLKSMTPALVKEAAARFLATTSGFAVTVEPQAGASPK